MKRILKILAVIAVIGVVVFGAIMFATSAARDTARNFVFDMSSGAFEQALDALHPETAAEFPVERMREIFGEAQRYTDVSFSSVETSGGQTNLTGTAKTDEGCSSIVNFRLVEGQILAFNFEPLCRVR